MTNASFAIPTDDIIVQEGTFAYSFVASGTISGSMLVKPAGPMQVVKCSDSQDNAIGIAGYYVTKGETVAVYGPGNIIRSCCASATAVGDDLFVGLGANFNPTFTYGGLAPCIGVALEGAAADSKIRILLK